MNVYDMPLPIVGELLLVTAAGDVV